MEKFILRQKWLGFCAVIFVSLLMALYLAKSATNAFETASPYIAKEVEYFLPITIENGEIISPKNTVIERNYEGYKVVLNTEVEDLNISDLQTGIYVTKNKFYSYDAKKGEVKIQSLQKVPNTVLTPADFKTLLNKNDDYIKPVLLFVFFFLISFFIGISSLFYAIILHWLFKRLYGADFALTLRVSTLAYLALFCVSTVLDISTGFIVTLLVMMACNYLANILLEKK